MTDQEREREREKFQKASAKLAREAVFKLNEVSTNLLESMSSLQHIEEAEAQFVGTRDKAAKALRAFARDFIRIKEALYHEKKHQQTLKLLKISGLDDSNKQTLYAIQIGRENYDQLLELTRLEDDDDRLRKLALLSLTGDALSDVPGLSEVISESKQFLAARAISWRLEFGQAKETDDFIKALIPIFKDDSEILRLLMDMSEALNETRQSVLSGRWDAIADPDESVLSALHELVKLNEKARVAGCNDLTKAIILGEPIETLCRPVLINEVDRRGETPLTTAIRRGDSKSVKVLIKNKANLEKANKNGDTPLRLALNSGNGQIEELLRDGGAKLLNEQNRGPRNAFIETLFAAFPALTEAMYAAHPDHGDNFAKYPINFDRMREANCNALTKAIIRGGPIEALCQPDLVNEIDGRGETPLTTAIQCGDLGQVKHLITKGAELNRPNSKGYAPLLMAISQRETEIFKILLDDGADPFAFKLEPTSTNPKNSISSLEIACSVDSVEIVERLVDRFETALPERLKAINKERETAGYEKFYGLTLFTDHLDTIRYYNDLRGSETEPAPGKVFSNIGISDKARKCIETLMREATRALNPIDLFQLVLSYKSVPSDVSKQALLKSLQELPNYLAVGVERQRSGDSPSLLLRPFCNILATLNHPGQRSAWHLIGHTDLKAAGELILQASKKWRVADLAEMVSIFSDELGSEALASRVRSDEFIGSAVRTLVERNSDGFLDLLNQIARLDDKGLVPTGETWSQLWSKALETMDADDVLSLWNDWRKDKNLNSLQLYGSSLCRLVEEKLNSLIEKPSESSKAFSKYVRILISVLSTMSRDVRMDVKYPKLIRRGFESCGYDEQAIRETTAEEAAYLAGAMAKHANPLKRAPKAKKAIKLLLARFEEVLYIQAEQEAKNGRRITTYTQMRVKLHNQNFPFIFSNATFTRITDGVKRRLEATYPGLFANTSSNSRL